MEKIKVTQKKSIIGQSQRKKDTLKALGLKKINHSVVHQTTPALQGMLTKVKHLITIQKL